MPCPSELKSSRLDGGPLSIVFRGITQGNVAPPTILHSPSLAPSAQYVTHPATAGPPFVSAPLLWRSENTKRIPSSFPSNPLPINRRSSQPTTRKFVQSSPPLPPPSRFQRYSNPTLRFLSLGPLWERWIEFARVQSAPHNPSIVDPLRLLANAH